MYLFCRNLKPCNDCLFVACIALFFSEYGFCKDGWAQFESQCYYALDIDDGQEYTHDQAAQECSNHGGILAVIASENINDFLTGMFICEN